MSVVSEDREYKFLTSRPLLKTRHYFAFSTPFEIENYNNVPLENRPATEFKKLIKGSIYRRNGSLIKHAEINCNYGSNYIYPINNACLPPIDYIDIVNCFLSKNNKNIMGKTLYLGNWMGHYGHFIIENLSRLWDMEKLKAYDNYSMHPFIFDGNSVKIHEYQSYILDLIGIETKKFKPIYKRNIFKSLDVPEQGWTIAGPINKASGEVYKKIRGYHSKKQIHKKIFISRRSSKMTRIKNISSVDLFFKKRGYEIIYPEEINIKQQLHIYSNAEVMASFSGSGLHNSVFSSSEALIIEIGDIRSSNKPMRMQVAAIELIGQRHRFIPYKGTGDGVYDVNHLENFNW